MKLIFCPSCSDLFRLFSEPRSCRCGKSWGRYTDDVYAEIGGEAVAVGVANDDFVRAYRRRGDVDVADSKRNFKAWFMRPDEAHVRSPGSRVR